MERTLVVCIMAISLLLFSAGFWGFVISFLLILVGLSYYVYISQESQEDIDL